MLEIPKQYESLEYVHNIDWQDVFAVWRAYEAYQKNWRKHWEERGFESWDEWRQNYIAPIKPEEKKWSVWRVNRPIEDFPKIYGVPSKGWQQDVYPEGVQTMPLREIVELLKTDFGKNEKVEAIKNNFPYQTMLTGIVNKGRIVLVEGMHRSLALVTMSENKIKGDVVLALAEHNEILPTVGKCQVD
jgi:hypothetical protein